MSSVIKKVAQIVRYPSETIEVVLALGLFIFGVFTMIPSEWLTGQTVYTSPIAKLLFGALILAPSLPLIFLALKHNGFNYQMQTRVRRKALFWVFVTYFYLAALRVFAVGVIPIIWVALLLLCVISAVKYLKLVNESE